MNSVTSKIHTNGLEYIDIETSKCKARIFLQGAQIDFFQPEGQAPLLWVSSADDYQAGNGIRARGGLLPVLPAVGRRLESIHRGREDAWH